MVAALYVERNGQYFHLPNVDPWDEGRDARQYRGPWPVVAHPPCNRWSRAATFHGQRDGADGGHFEHALSCVRRFGGVLEHPKHTLAWKHHALPLPAGAGWTRSLWDEGWTCEVDQRLYGHDTRKPTWLYYVGPDPPPLRWGRGAPGRRTVETRAGGGTQHLRSRTPAAFRDFLIGLAEAHPNALTTADPYPYRPTGATPKALYRA